MAVCPLGQFGYGVDFSGDINTINDNPEVMTEYCVTVNDGCETSPISICTETHMRPVPAPTFTSDKTAVCNPGNATFFSSGIFSDSVIWKIDGNTFPNRQDITYRFTSVGLYDISLEIYNEFGCHADITATNYFESIAIPKAKLFINPNPTTIFNTEIILTPGIENFDDTYQWLTPEGLPEESDDESPRILYPEGIPNTYEITLIVTNDFGCTDTVSDFLEIISDVIIYAPNAFTPDGDVYNESWGIYIDGIDFYNFHLTIFNRWGEIVWESFDASSTWNGSYGNSGIVDDGTYIWLVTAKESTTDKKLTFNGMVTILK